MDTSEPDNIQAPYAAAESPVISNSVEPPGDKGCMVFLAFLLILPPFIFLFAFPVLFVLVGVFFGWLTWLPFQKNLLKSVAPWKAVLALSITWLLVMLGLFFLLGNLDSFRQLHGGRY